MLSDEDILQSSSPSSSISCSMDWLPLGWCSGFVESSNLCGM